MMPAARRQYVQVLQQHHMLHRGCTSGKHMPLVLGLSGVAPLSPRCPVHSGSLLATTAANSNSAEPLRAEPEQVRVQ